MAGRGVVAAGHPATAVAGAAVLRDGGNAVDAAVAAVLTSLVAEPLLTGLGAGGYMLVAPPDGPPVLLDFFVEAPGCGADVAGRVPLLPVLLSFGDATQLFHVGPSSCGTYGVPAGLVAAVEQFGRAPLAELIAPAVALARRGVRVNAMQAYLFALLAGVVGSTPECAARYFLDGRPPGEGDLHRDPELADALDRLGSEGSAPFYTGDIGRAVSGWVRDRGGMLTGGDLAAYAVVRREPLRVAYRGREVFTNPPPSAGGALLGRALATLDARPGPPDALAFLAAMAAADDARGLAVPGPAHPGIAAMRRADRLGSTTHVSVLDADGWACSVTTSNGACSGVSVPGTGIHLNNMLGEEDLSPCGPFTHAVGDRLPSMTAPTVVRRDGIAELVLGSAGSNRIRSALLQVIAHVVDGRMSPQRAVDAPRLHLERGAVHAEPGIDVAALRATGRPVSVFGAPNLFFGGCQAVGRDPRSGAVSGGADGRRGGAVALA
jgi:gamma-glutamyltranspeptidase/glutathione hydrolase